MKNIHPCIEEVLISNDQIVKKCEELGKAISADYEGKCPVLIGLLKGSVPFMAELIKHITCDIQIDFMDVSSYNGVESTGVVRFLKDISCDVKGRDILFVEDIIDTGLTLHAVVQEFKTRQVKSIEIVSMLDKPEGRKVDDMNPKYVGFSIPKKFVVGFGLDYNELYRNLPYVGVLKREVYEK
jgi:hypoxanthine phosphoribosyltransferase